MLVPEIYEVDAIDHETEDVFSLRLHPKENEKSIPFLPGQFNMLYHFGIGEVPISISSDPSSSNVLTHTIRAVGSVTKGMQKLKAGDKIGVRGPFGCGWPMLKDNCDVLIIAGGIGLAPLRPALCQFASTRERYRNITLLYGARNPKDIIFKQDLQNWERQGININVTVDFADTSWMGRVGVVTSLIKKKMTSPNNTLVYICGPEIMIKFAIHELSGLGADEKEIFIALERNMQCAVGFCGLCQYGPYFICKDGAVFSYEKLKPWLMIKEL